MTRRLKVAGAVLALVSLALAVSHPATAISTAQTHLQPGDRATVFGTGPTGLSVREGPGAQFPLLITLPSDTEVSILEGPTWRGTTPWYLITGYDEAAHQGWAAGNYLQAKEEVAPAEEPAAAEGRTASSRGGQRDSRSFVAIVTAYGLVGRTASGALTRWGIVAVDPAVIPLGSRIQIDGFEETFVAADTGGGIRGAWVDIWFPSYGEARQFGVQSRRVTILEP